MTHEVGHMTHFTQPAMPWKIKLSILLGTYNRLGMLKYACIPSARDSIFPHSYEFVVVDAGSTDGTKEWLRKQEDVTLVEQQLPLKGAGAAINAGAPLCKGQYVAILNDDILIEGPALAQAVSMLDNDPYVGQVAIPWSQNHNPLATEPTEAEWVSTGSWKIASKTDKPGMVGVIGRNGLMYANFGVIRRELGEEAGWWGPHKHFYGDPHLSMYVRSKGLRVKELATGVRIVHLEAPSYGRGDVKEWREAGYEDYRDHETFIRLWGDMIDR